MKIKWVQYLHDRQVPWFYSALPIKDQRIWLANTHPKHIKIRENCIDFARHIWKAWSIFNYNDPAEPEQIQAQILWGNSHILRNNKPIWNQSLLLSSIDYASKLVNTSEHTFLTGPQLIARYGQVLDPLLYEAIKVAIPQLWKQILKYHEVADKVKEPCHNYHTVIRKGKIVSFVFWELINRESADSTTRMAWNVELHTDLDEEQWENLCISAFKISNCVKLRYFQYRILHRILTLNTLGNKWDSSVSPNCSFCGSVPETLRHLLYECKYIDKLWLGLKKWCKYFYKITLNINHEAIIFNNIVGPNAHFGNTLILIMKRYM